MNKPRLYVHIGTHKTGSTAIQHFLSQNDAFLRTKGFVYLNNFQEFNTMEFSEKLDNKLVVLCRKELESKSWRLNKIENQYFIMSSEGFSGNPLIGYKNTEIIAKYLSQITTNFEVYIIVYLRRQDDFIESLYTQKIHEGESYTFKSFLDSLHISSFDWNHLLSCYAEEENI